MNTPQHKWESRRTSFLLGNGSEHHNMELKRGRHVISQHQKSNKKRGEFRCSRRVGNTCPTLGIAWFSNLLTWRVHDEGYSRNVSCTPNDISQFSFNYDLFIFLPNHQTTHLIEKFHMQQSYQDLSHMEKKFPLSNEEQWRTILL